MIFNLQLHQLNNIYVLLIISKKYCFAEQPSSSSLSTTTSSVTSMTSLEHESNDTSASASDYGNNDWDNENWGEMDVRLVRFK